MSTSAPLHPQHPAHEVANLVSEKWRGLDPNRLHESHTGRLIEDIIRGATSIPVSEPGNLRFIAQALHVTKDYLINLERVYVNAGGRPSGPSKRPYTLRKPKAKPAEPLPQNTAPQESARACAWRKAEELHAQGLAPKAIYRLLQDSDRWSAISYTALLKKFGPSERPTPGNSKPPLSAQQVARAKKLYDEMGSISAVRRQLQDSGVDVSVYTLTRILRGE